MPQTIPINSLRAALALVCLVVVADVRAVGPPENHEGAFAQHPARQAARAPRAGASPTLEALLNASGLDYTHDKSGVFKVVVSVEGETTLIFAQEGSLGSGNNPDLRLVTLTCPVVVVPKGFKHPPAMLKKIATTNDSMLVGKLSVDAEAGNIWYASSFWLRTATSKVLINELYIAHYLRLDLRKELLPFVNE